MKSCATLLSVPITIAGEARRSNRAVAINSAKQTRSVKDKREPKENAGIEKPKPKRSGESIKNGSDKHALSSNDTPAKNANDAKENDGGKRKQKHGLKESGRNT